VRLFAAILLVALSASASASGWEKIEGCRLLTDEYFDGDSFHVRGAGRQKIFRLYAVDAPEMDKKFPQRIKDQSRHFKVTQKALLEGAQQAKDLAASLMARPFTVETKWVDARGDSGQPRYFAKITLSDGSDLGVRLVEAGLARSFGMREGMTAAYLSRLDRAQDAARAQRRGLWGAGGEGSAAASSSGASAAAKERGEPEETTESSGLDTQSIFEQLRRESEGGL
jgi:endonuclease YncB( thermonuclease family)